MYVIAIAIGCVKCEPTGAEIELPQPHDEIRVLWLHELEQNRFELTLVGVVILFPRAQCAEIVGAVVGEELNNLKSRSLNLVNDL